MAYVPIPKDLSNVKTKVMFNLTKRQLICFSIAGVVGVPVFFLTKDFVGTSTAVLLMMFVMFPMFMFAMYEKHNQPLEVILKNYYNVRFANPKKRPYMTDNFYNILERQDKLDKEVTEIVKQQKTQTNSCRTKTSKSSTRKSKKQA
ncbi:PrgI family protein [Tannockella kyphosi]|uniref:PrgI family protein n=1 Tax=Tannockella kyphosi TaxID=2899121 RepID=UPI002011B101|nr:PrgI family protein [Tannockella kyphosi]